MQLELTTEGSDGDQGEATDERAAAAEYNRHEVQRSKPNKYKVRLAQLNFL